MTWPPPTLDLADVCPFCGHERVPDLQFPRQLVHVIDHNRYWTLCPVPEAKADPLVRPRTQPTPGWR